MSNVLSHCSIEGFFAADANKAVLLRRGPTDWVQQILWDTQADLFVTGQWFYGRIKIDRCDISALGNYFIYFAQKYHLQNSEFRTFTAICKPPYFTAITLWPIQHSWGGGGIFLNDRVVWLCHEEAAMQVHKDFPNTLFTLQELPNSYQSASLSPQELKVGWQELLQDCRAVKAYVLKNSNQGSFFLVKELINNQDGKMVVIYYLYDDRSGERTQLKDVLWAGFDQRGRLITSSNGCLYVTDLNQRSLIAKLLIDLNNQKISKREV